MFVTAISTYTINLLYSEIFYNYFIFKYKQGPKTLLKEQYVIVNKN